jgi:RND family efflux transporter MFP subunit
MNKASLVNQLRIDREEERPVHHRDGGGGGPWLGWILGSIVVLAVVGAGGWFAVARPDLMKVRSAVAQAAPSGAAGQAASLLDASGYVVARRQATVSSKITGKVMQALVEEGQHVEAGQVLARLDDSNIRANRDQAAAQVRAAETNLKLAQVALTQAGPTFQRSQKMFETGYLSAQGADNAKAAYDTARYNLEAAQRQLAVTRAGLQAAQDSVNDTVVRAPFAGVVTVKNAQPGEMVSPISAGGGFTRTGICTIVDMDSLEVEVDVAESFINRVRDGMPATVKLNAYPDWLIPAEVIAVIPTADRSKATVAVRIGFKVKDPRIVPEMGARVSFLSPTTETASAAAPPRGAIVPNEAVQPGDSDGQGVVFVIVGHKLERRAVKLGATRPQGVTILGGVQPGEEVALGDQSKFKDGMSVKVKAGGE